MSIIYVLIPIAILLTIIGIYLFFWAVKTEQFNDLEKQGLSILFEDDDSNKTTIDKKIASADNTAKENNHQQINQKNNNQSQTNTHDT